MRIGVNWGSLDRALLTRLMDENARRPEPLADREVVLEAMRESALRSAELAERFGQPHDRIVLSAKVSEVRDLVARLPRARRGCDYPLHLGLTEAGHGHARASSRPPRRSRSCSRRASATRSARASRPRPGGDRADEVRVCQQMLQSLGIRHFTPAGHVCPGCGRTTSTFFQELAADVTAHIQARIATGARAIPGVEELRVAVMGCVVNGPGESKHADIGISLPGTGEEPRAPVYVDGKLTTTLKGDTIAADFAKLLDEYVEQRFASPR